LGASTKPGAIQVAANLDKIITALQAAGDEPEAAADAS